MSLRLVTRDGVEVVFEHGQYRLAAAADFLQISLRELYREIERGNIATRGQGRMHRIDAIEIVRYLERGRNDQEAA